jgi:hypothetical protein
MKTKPKQTDSNVQNTTQQYPATRTLLQPDDELRCSAWQLVPFSHVAPVLLFLLQARLLKSIIIVETQTI